jgi:hypothetical protein
MSNTYTDSITTVNAKPALNSTAISTKPTIAGSITVKPTLNSTSISVKPALAGTITIKPTISGTITNEPYVGLYALLTENGYEVLFEDQSAMNMENL